MAKVRITPGGFEISGRVGNVVYRRCGGCTIIGPRPAPRRRKPTEAQLAGRNRFRKAVVYGQSVIADADLRAIYERIEAGMPAYLMAVRDFLTSPTVDDIDLFAYRGEPGDVVSIAASDDTEVVAIVVALTTRDGVVLEEGPAEMNRSGRWIYAATERVAAGTTVRVAATAVDRPGGTHTLETETDV